MTKTNSYQRAKARVKELEKELDVSMSNVIKLGYLHKQKSDDLENAVKEAAQLQCNLNTTFKEAADVLAESANLKEHLIKERNTTKAFIVLSLLLTIGIIVLIATI